MAHLKVYGGAVITRFVSFSKNQSRTLTVQTALDGTEYLTRFGAPLTDYNLTVQVNAAGRDALLSAADALTLLEVSVSEGVFTGRIKELSDFERLVSGWYQASAVLSSVSEVSGR